MSITWIDTYLTLSFFLREIQELSLRGLDRNPFFLSEAGVDSRKGDDDGPLKWLGPLFRSRPQPPGGLWFQKATWKAPSWVICKASPRAWGAVPMAESLTCPPVTELTAVKERQQCGCGNVYSVFILTF